jgi:hypothetical protein
MKLLLDECVPRKLKNHLPGVECQTVPEAGLAGKKNGELLSRAEQAGFQVFLTVEPGHRVRAKSAASSHRSGRDQFPIKPAR